MSKEVSNRPVRILCLEDNREDRDLLELTLANDGMQCEFVHTQSREEFEAAIEDGRFDLIISDFSLPSYDGMSALVTARKARAEIPFIFVSGTIGEERAIESLKGGATDYVLKDRRDRLISAVRRALRESRERTERQQLEEQLRQSQKMEAIGQLAGGIAHDFNNLLTVIQGNAELALSQNHLLNDELRELLKQITDASGRASNLTRQLLAFSRKQAVHLQPVNLRDVVANLMRMLERVVGEDISLRWKCDGNAVFVQADVGMLEQVILNLVVNARDAMPNGGDLTITAAQANPEAMSLPIRPGAGEGEFACLTISDSGCGIAPEHLPRIFEPFFTTKDVGKGTGLGLATVYGIVKQHNGWIDVSSEVGAGTTFRILLPAIRPVQNTSSTTSRSGVSAGGSERILLVEDEPAVRLFTKRILIAFGYQVVEAASGREAIEAWGREGAQFDLLLTDIVMPEGMTGPQLAEELGQKTPGIKVIFMTGYGAEVVLNGTDRFKGKDSYVLYKPFQSTELVQIVRECLNRVAKV